MWGSHSPVHAGFDLQCSVLLVNDFHVQICKFWIHHFEVFFFKLFKITYTLGMVSRVAMVMDVLDILFWHAYLGAPVPAWLPHSLGWGTRGTCSQTVVEASIKLFGWEASIKIIADGRDLVGQVRLFSVVAMRRGLLFFHLSHKNLQFTYKFVGPVWAVEWTCPYFLPFREADISAFRTASVSYSRRLPPCLHYPLDS